MDLELLMPERRACDYPPYQIRGLKPASTQKGYYALAYLCGLIEDAFTKILSTDTRTDERFRVNVCRDTLKCVDNSTTIRIGR